MPLWGRPPGGRDGVGRYMEEPEDVYRFQEVDSDDEKNGVMVEPELRRVSNGKQFFNPDELYFNDMDIRAWERRTAELDGLAYGEDYSYLEDEGYYEEPAEVTMSAAEYEELLFQRVLDKIRLARATGQADVQLTPEELDAYQTRLWRPRVPAARPQAARARPVSAPVANGSASTAVAATTGTGGVSGSGSARSKKNHRRTSFFGSSRPKKEKSSSRTRATSNAPDAINQAPAPGPGFIVLGPNGQPMYAPINAYQGRMTRDGVVRPSGSPSRQSSRSASISSDKLPPLKGASSGDAARAVRQAQTPPRVSPPREVPGAFPSSSPQRYREPTPPQAGRPSSSSSRQSIQDNNDHQLPPKTRGRSSSIQQTPKLVPFPISEYKHYNAEPYHYQVPGQLAASQPPTQPQYNRRVVSGPAESNYMAMPRRVPVPVQRAAAPMSSAQGSFSDPALVQGASGSRAEVSDEGDGQDGVLVDVVPQADDRGYKVQTVKPTKEGSSGGNSKDSERRRKSGRNRRKN